MRPRSLILVAAAALALIPAAGAFADDTGTVSGLRAQVTRFLTAELHRDSSTVCAILGTPMNGTRHGRSCEQRWQHSLRRMLRRGDGTNLRADRRAVATAAVSSDGVWATITLPHPLLAGVSRFSWYDNCWMLER
jgi:hypothetical protein